MLLRLVYIILGCCLLWLLLLFATNPKTPTALRKLLVIIMWGVGCFVFFFLGRGILLAGVLGWKDGDHLKTIFAITLLGFSWLFCFAEFQQFIWQNLKNK